MHESIPGCVHRTMKFLIILFYIFSALLMIHSLYFGLYGLWGLFFDDRIFEDTDKRAHFAVMIPARNEEIVIGDLVDSIRGADYPSSLIDIYVVANNCTDNTAGIASERGATVIYCTEPANSKADALRFAIDRLKDDVSIDAYVVFDADNIVDPAFFTELNKALVSGAPAVQCRRTGKNLRSTWVSACYETYYAMQNTFFNHPRNAAGLSAAINGTGWAVRKDILDENGFEFYTITEDLEMTLDYAIKGIHIAYCRAAVVYDEFTCDIRTSMRQRVRWTFGMEQNLKRYQLTLFKKCLHSRQCFDAAMLNIIPQVMMMSIVFSIIASILAFFTLEVTVSFLTFIAAPALGIWICTGLLSLVALIRSGSNVKDNIKGIISFPLFIMTWIPILISCQFRHDVKWTPIEHTQSVSISERKKGNSDEKDSAG